MKKPLKPKREEIDPEEGVFERKPLSKYIERETPKVFIH